jgi:hypothetical protein
MQTNTNNLKYRDYYRQPVPKRGEYLSSTTPAEAAAEAPEQINLSIRIPLPDISRSSLLKAGRKVLTGALITAAVLFLLDRGIWYLTHLPTK